MQCNINTFVTLGFQFFQNKFTQFLISQLQVIIGDDYIKIAGNVTCNEKRIGKCFFCNKNLTELPYSISVLAVFKRFCKLSSVSVCRNLSRFSSSLIDGGLMKTKIGFRLELRICFTPSISISKTHTFPKFWTFRTDCLLLNERTSLKNFYFHFNIHFKLLPCSIHITTECSMFQEVTTFYSSLHFYNANKMVMNTIFLTRTWFTSRMWYTVNIVTCIYNGPK